jgi:D-threo-aldose 1-dehydrogenase
MYGLGAAEAELGKFARGRRDEITIATKFGIEPAKSVEWTAGLQRPARAIMARFPAVRAAIKRRGEALNAPRRYDARAATRSLERSLAEVGTDYFDILFVHDPQPWDEVIVEEVDDFFHRAHHEGKIRSWGVASESARGADLVEQLGPKAIPQLRYDLLTSHSLTAADGRGRIVFGFLAATLPRLSAHLDADRRVRAEWSNRLGFDSLTIERLAELLLIEAVDSNPGAVVLLSTTQQHRLQGAAELVDSFADKRRLTMVRELAGQTCRQTID